MRYLIILGLALLAYWAIRTLWPALPSRGEGRTEVSDEMVRCEQCGAYAPRSQTVTAGIMRKVHTFCSPQCRDAYRLRKTSGKNE